MSEVPQYDFIDPSQDEEPQRDLTGTDRLVSNVIFSWAAHFVFIIAGFIMPRMIDRRLGQELLGVWDFSWSLISYFGLVQGGIGSSVNRYVAKYRATHDVAGINRTVSSAFCLLGLAGMLVLAMTAALSLLLPRLFGDRLGENVLAAQWVVFFLGGSIGIQMAFGVFNGVLTGCHRWELHNITKSGWHVATVAAMILALAMGLGLPSLSVISFIGIALTEATETVLAYRACKGLRLRISLVGWKTIRKLFVFGGKSLIPSVSNLLLNQTTSILIVAYLGPAALALFSRPRSIIHQINTLVNKMAFVLTPTASSLQSTGNMEGIQGLLIKSGRYSLYMVLPMVLILTVFGDAIMQFWMGPRYANGLIPAILAVGNLAMMVQAPSLSVLRGLNAHGRAGMAQFVASVCSVALSILVLRYLKWNTAAVAIAVTLPLTIANFLYLPILIRHRVGLHIGKYFLSVSAGPVILALPFGICLVGARLFFQTKPLTGLLWGGSVGSLALAALYWRFVLPVGLKMRILRFTSLAAVTSR